MVDVVFIAPGAEITSEELLGGGDVGLENHLGVW
jgi:hypothetical protein